MYLLLIVVVFGLLGGICLSQKNCRLKSIEKSEKVREAENKKKYEEFDKHYTIIKEASNLEEKEDREIIYEDVKRYSKLIKEAKKIQEANELKLRNIRFSVKSRSLKDIAYDYYINNKDETFKNKLLSYIDNKDLKDSDVYNEAQVSRQVFNNIINIKGYIPKKRTIFKLILAMRLKIEEAVELLGLADYSFSDYKFEDIYVKLCIENEIYDVKKIYKEISSLEKQMSNEN